MVITGLKRRAFDNLGKSRSIREQKDSETRDC